MDQDVKKNLVVFVLVVFLLAWMDVFNFVVPHNSGFFSLTYGDDFPIRFDIWHLLKVLVLGLILFGQNKFKGRDYFFFYLIGAVLAFVIQIILYNWLLKELINKTEVLP